MYWGEDSRVMKDSSELNRSSDIILIAYCCRSVSLPLL